MFRGFLRYYLSKLSSPLPSLSLAAAATLVGTTLWPSPVVQCHGATADCGCRRRRSVEMDTYTQQAEQQNWEKLPVYTAEQVAKHDGRQSPSVWMSYGGLVYDVTKFLPIHPGGTARIQRAAGSAIEPYWFLHTQHFRTEEPMQILSHLVVGRLAEADQDRIDADLDALQEKLDSFRLECQTRHGRRFHFSLDDLQKLPQTDRLTRIGCESKQKGSVATTLFAGVLLRDLMAHMGVPRWRSVRKVIFEAMDGESLQLEKDEIDLNGVLIAFEENGQPLSQGRGFPLRVIIPNKRVIKWVRRIEIL